MSEKPEFLSVAGSAAYSKRSVRWISRRIQCGLLTPHKADDGRVVLISVAELDAIKSPHPA